MISNKNFHRFLRFLPNFLWPIRIIIYKIVIGKHGKNLKFGPNVTFYNFREIEIGHNVFIGDGTTFGGNVSIKIGDNVMFGPEVMIRGGDHNFSVVGKSMREAEDGGINLPITIEDDVWIGTRAIILKGVTIGEGAIIGAGSIVTRDVLPYTINVGCPSKPFKGRFSINDLSSHLDSVNSKYDINGIVELYKFKNLSALFEKK